MTTRSRIPLALAAVLLLAGCAPEWWGAEGSSTVGEPSVPSPSVTAGGSAQDEESGDESNGCPVGAWTLDNESWQAELTRIWGESGAPGAEVAVTGRLDLDWSDGGTYVLSADQSSYVIDGVASGVTFTQTVRHDGDERGTWSGSGDTYELVAGGASGMTSVVTMSGAGGEVVYDQSDVVTEPWSGELVVECTGSGMTTTVTEQSGTLSVAWVRR